MFSLSKLTFIHLLCYNYLKQVIITQKKEDIRIKKTEFSIKKALFSLLKKTDFEKLSVIEICNKAKVNRATFYHHYKDKYELLDSCLNSIKKKIIKEYNIKSTNLTFNIDTSECLYILSEILVDTTIRYQDIIYNLIQNKNDDIAAYMLKTSCDEAIKNIVSTLDQYTKTKLIFPIDLSTTFISGGVASVIIYWLDNRTIMRREEFLSCLKEAINFAISAKNLYIK